MKSKLLLFSLLAVLSFRCQKTKEIIDAVDPASLHNRSVGSSANELLSASRYTSLKVEVQYMPGFAPDAGAISHLQNFLAARLNKPDGISIVTKEVAAAGNATLSANEVHAFEKANRTVFTTGNQLAVYVLYTNGNYSENNVLGVAYRNTSVALFGKKIRDNSGGIGQASRTKLEATVLEHELGHLLGLVDIGTPMQSQHKANGNHCNNQECLMFHAAETTDVLGLLITGNIPSLDGACVADIKANGAK
jgi:predicted Zn-dependent protease